MRILFIGNSHTYYNDMPYLFAELARAAGQDVDVTMLTRGGESLAGHIKNEQTRFNLLYGRYDLAVLQEVTSEFPEIKEYFDGVRTLTTNIVMEMGYSTDLHRQALIGTAVVLFVFVLIINISFSLIKRRSKQ